MSEVADFYGKCLVDNWTRHGSQRLSPWLL
jgi:hypothetical protein